jgi:hypothetical protein
VRCYCTFFDRNYLARGLALHRSLVRHAGEFVLYVLALDERTRDVLTAMRLPQVRVVPLEELEKYDPALPAVKKGRGLFEYYFTCTPILLRYLMDRVGDAEVVTYLDADFFFFADPSPICQELGDGAIHIMPHRGPPDMGHQEIHGVYNSGWVSFRKCAEGRTCLNWWRERSLEWCYDRVEPGRYAGQKYLDDWPTRFSGVVVLQHKGAGLAPWNVRNYTLTESDGQVWVDDRPLILYHFHGLRWVRPWLVQSRLNDYRVWPSRILKHRLYAPYLREILRIERQLKAGLGSSRGERPSAVQRNPLVVARPGADGGPITRLRAEVQYLREFIYAVRTEKLWIVLGDRLI